MIRFLLGLIFRGQADLQTYFSYCCPPNPPAEA